MRVNRRFAQVMAVAAVIGFAHGALAGPFSDWDYRTRIGLDNASGTQSLVDFPVQITLNAGNFDFSRAAPDGSDLRVAAPGGSPLSYELEKWDSAGQQAVIWAKVPQVNAGANTGFVDVFYGNVGATDAQNVADVWSNGYKGVWHLDGSGTAVDSTGRHDGTVTGAGVTSAQGAIGDGRAFDSSNHRIEARTEDIAPGVSSLDAADDITFSYWMKGSTGQPGGYTRALSKNIDGISGWEYQRGGADAHQNVRIDTTGGNNQVRRTGTNAFDDAWHFNGLTIDSGTVKGYLDGGAPSTYSYNHGGGFANTLPLVIGARANGANQFSGMLDEVRFADVVRSDAWMNAEHRAQSGQMTSVGPSTLYQGLRAEYTHEAADPLMDTSGNGRDATTGGVTFVPVADPQGFAAGLGATVGSYIRNENDRLDVPSDVVALGDSFTYIALVNKDDQVMGGHRSILTTDRFRYQWSTSGTTQEEREDNGQLRIDITGGGGTSVGNFDIDTWYFTALTYDATTNKGQAWLQGSSPVLTSPAFTFTPTNPLTNLTAFRIGADGLSGIGGDDGWDGRIDSARFHEGVLTKAQLRDVLRGYLGTAPGPIGKVAQYSHEGADPLADDTGHGLAATNRGGVAFVAPTAPGDFLTGSVVGDYPRTSNGALDVPQLHTTGDDFTFVALVRKNSDESGGFQTILGSDRFRFQFSNTGTTSDGEGRLRLDINSPGAAGSAEGQEGDFLTEEWYFVAMTYDAATNQIDTYLQPDSPVFLSSHFSRTANGADGIGDMTRFRIGGDGLSGIGSTDAFGGQIDNVRFYDQVFDKRAMRDVFRELHAYAGGPIGLVAKHDLEGTNPLTDDTGHLMDLRNRGAVTFVAPPSPGDFALGSVAAQYPRTTDGALDAPALHTPGDDFTFIAMVRKDADAPGQQTILATDRFRFQFQGTSADAGRLRLDIDGAGATGSSEGPAGWFETEDWYFVALTYDATTKQIEAYLQPDSPVFLAPIISRTASGALGLDDMSRFRIGCDDVSGIGGPDAFGGHMDGTRFYDQTFTRAQLSDIFRTMHAGTAGPFGLVASYGHEGPDPLADDTGHRVPVFSGGGVSFVAPPEQGAFRPGNVVGQYSRSGSSYLDLPGIHVPGDDFTFVALVRKNSDESGGHQTILSTNRFRFQYRDTGGANGSGTLRLDVNGAGATWPGESGDGTFLTEEWYFVALRYDSALKTIDAFLHDDSSRFLTGPAFTRLANGIGLDDMTRFRIGADGLSALGGFDAFGGWIDGARFYDQYLTDADLQAMFDQVWVPEPATLLLLGGGLLALARRRRRTA